MQKDDIQILVSEGESLLFPIHQLESLDSTDKIVSINNFVVLPIIIAKYYDRSQRIIEVFDEHNALLGYIYCSKTSTIIQEEDIPEWLFSVYLVDVEEGNQGIYSIEKDYIAIQRSQYENYKNNYYTTAPIWGSFYHTQQTNISSPQTTIIQRINAIPNLELPTTWHQQAMIRAVQQPYAFERFLKNYHLLELLFDWQLVQTIKNLGNDLPEIGKILVSYSRDDIKRLKFILEKKCTNEHSLARKLDRIKHFMPKAKEIFYKYGKKDSNPLKELTEGEQQLQNIIDGGGFTNQQNLKSNKVNFNLSRPYSKFITDLSAYWIYRIRSSIAHHKIGEYLMSPSDEKFMVEFAEPLLKEVLIQCFTKPTS